MDSRNEIIIVILLLLLLIILVREVYVEYSYGSIKENIPAINKKQIGTSNQQIDEISLDQIYPYADLIQNHKWNLRINAAQIVRTCPSGDQTCEAETIYSYILNNFRYVSDPRYGEELLQTPEETEEIRAGDCEDLTALLNSYLESLGIKTYLVFTKGHVSSLICNINIQPDAKHPLITSWPLNGQKCYPLDATAGKNGYIGSFILSDKNYGPNGYEPLYAVDVADYSISKLVIKP